MLQAEIAALAFRVLHAQEKMRNHPNVGFTNKSFEATHIMKT